LGPAAKLTVMQVIRPAAPLVVDPSGVVFGTGSLGPERIAERSTEAMISDAEAEVAATVADLDAEATARVVTGDPGPTLCRIADEDDDDLLVVGSHGSGFLKRVVLGSVSHHVLHHATCPVLVVPASVDDANGTDQ
jgi:nucleotide-binding universal stress UspA family protein